MESDNLLVAIAVAVVMFSVVGTFATYNSVSNYKDFVTGFNVETGNVNITIETSAAVIIKSANGVLDSKNLSWGSGTVDGGESYAILASDGRMINGSDWNVINEGFIVKNIGNTNVTLDIHANPIASQFIGGNSPAFQYNVTNYLEGSCSDFPLDVESVYNEFTDSPTRICNDFSYSATTDELRIDILLKIPLDSLTGTRNSTITLTYDEV
jgi:hypothetical protein